MSLVAYYSSSEDESENEETCITTTSTSSKNSTNGHSSIVHQRKDPVKSASNEISDDDDDIPTRASSLTLNLPKPSKPTNDLQIEEEDDEFLHKTVPISEVEKPPPPKPVVRLPKPRQPVKITIPSLRNFDKEIGPTVMNNIPAGPQPSKGAGLMNLLPPPKASLGGGKSSGQTVSLAASNTSTKPMMIPHTVKKHINSKQVTKSTATTTSVTSSSKPALTGFNYSDDSDDDDAEDFFSLNNEDKTKLPEISAKEIQNMVARRSASLVAASQKLDQELAEQKRHAKETYEAQQQAEAARYAAAQAAYQKQMDLQALCGSQAKRARGEEIEFIEVNQNEVVPSKDEWMRNQLAGVTEYQPKGLVGYDEPGSGTKKKHQITYLAYQAKANESELQAMWAANRHSRKQTQNKYGF